MVKLLHPIEKIDLRKYVEAVSDEYLVALVDEGIGSLLTNNSVAQAALYELLSRFVNYKQQNIHE